MFVVAEPPQAAQSAPEAPPDPVDEARMTIIEHLEELRRVLIVSLVAWALGTVVGLAVSDLVLRVIIQPLSYLHLRPVYFSPMGNFTVHLKVGLFTGFVLALPVVLNRAWTFIAPGLKSRERRLAMPLLVSSLLLFAMGALLAYFFTYIAVRIIGAFGVGDLSYVAEINQYLGFVLILVIAFGVCFEFPIVLVLLGSAGIVGSAWLAKKRMVAYFIIGAVAFAVTPGVDPITPLALAVPLWLLYEVSIFVLRRMKK